MGVIVGVDGGNSKTTLLAASVDGELLGFARGPGSNSHAVGADGCAAIIAELLEEVAPPLPAEAGSFFLCGADVRSDVDELERAIGARGWVGKAIVDNDTMALLHAGSTAADVVAVVCGAGINCLGRASGGREARYPSLGWETGDWGGAQMLGREALYLAARAEDGRGEPTALTDVIRSHFDRPSVAAVGEAIHYRRLADTTLGSLAPAVVAAGAAGDAVARSLVERLAAEIVLLVERAFRDLELARGEVVLGGGMLRGGEGLFHDLVVAGLPRGAEPVVVRDPLVLGAGLAALDAVGAGDDARERLRRTLREVVETGG